jgi:AcrR family transcriptional regulator
MQQTALPPLPAASATARRGIGVARSGQTRQALLDAAERLFAERGVNWVSMREIVRASQQHNTSAALYHFGSREALIVAVVGASHRQCDAASARRTEACGRHTIAKGDGGGDEPLAECAHHRLGCSLRANLFRAQQRPADSPEVQWHTGHLSSMLRVETLVQRCFRIWRRRCCSAACMLRNHTTYASAAGSGSMAPSPRRIPSAFAEKSKP